jgi:hypothetical protein
VTAKGHPRSIFKRAIEHGNLMAGEMTARELGRIPLSESLALTSLVVQKDPGRRPRFTVRWLLRLLEDGDLYVTNFGGNTVREFSPTGVDLGDFASTGLSAPAGLAFSPRKEDENGDD